MYSSIDLQADHLVDLFCGEAERLWELENGSLSTINMVAAQFMSLAYLVREQDDAVLKYLLEAVRIGTSLGLFGVNADMAPYLRTGLSPEVARATAYSAWGIFNWTT